MDRSIFWQAYQALDDAGPEGITQIELGKKMGEYLYYSKYFSQT